MNMKIFSRRMLSLAVATLVLGGSLLVGKAYLIAPALAHAAC